MNRRRLRTLGGILLWVLALAGANWALARSDRGGVASTPRLLWRHFTQHASTFEVTFLAARGDPGLREDPIILEVGAPVYARAGGEEAMAIREVIVGEVAALLDAGGQPLPDLYAEVPGVSPRVRVTLYDRERPAMRADASVRLVRVPMKLNWVIHTLLTDDAVKEVAADWNRTMLRHREELFELLVPVVEEFLRDAEGLIAGGLRAFAERHRDEVRAAGDAVAEELGGEELVELFYTAVWPLSEGKLRPIAEAIGAEIWRMFPLWSLSWRLAYEKLPMTDDDHFDRAWEEFVQSRIVPILRAHSGDLLAALREIGREALEKPEVNDHLRRAFRRLIGDPRLQGVARDFLKEMALDNPEFHDLVRRQWSSPAVQTALARAASFLEPMLRRMGDVVFGTRAGGIKPEFARVLRSQILLKDQQRIVLDPGSAGAPELAAGAALEAFVEWETPR
jgi:hypothetical protein